MNCRPRRSFSSKQPPPPWKTTSPFSVGEARPKRVGTPTRTSRLTARSIRFQPAASCACSRPLATDTTSKSVKLATISLIATRASAHQGTPQLLAGDRGSRLVDPSERRPHARQAVLEHVLRIAAR
jgi:hypothetical protein